MVLGSWYQVSVGAFRDDDGRVSEPSCNGEEGDAGRQLAGGEGVAKHVRGDVESMALTEAEQIPASVMSIQADRLEVGKLDTELLRYRNAAVLP